jgi:hypothetical protein
MKCKSSNLDCDIDVIEESLAKGNWLLTPNNYILKNKKINNDETK